MEVGKRAREPVARTRWSYERVLREGADGGGEIVTVFEDGERASAVVERWCVRELEARCVLY